MLTPFIIYYKYQLPGGKRPGAVKQFRLYANDLEEARRMASQHANYPNIEIIRVKRA